MLGYIQLSATTGIRPGKNPRRTPETGITIATLPAPITKGTLPRSLSPSGLEIWAGAHSDVCSRDSVPGTGEAPAEIETSMNAFEATAQVGGILQEVRVSVDHLIAYSFKDVLVGTVQFLREDGGPLHESDERGQP